MVLRDAWIQGAIRRFALLLAFFATVKAHSQQHTIAFDHLTAEDGLSHSTVYALLQDRYGLIWIGTRYGLNRFDGYDCEVFLHEAGNSGTINGPSVYCLFEDTAGNIWVGQREAGISVWDPQKGKFEAFPNLPTEPNLNWGKTTIRSIFEDSRGWLWVGTLGYGAFVFDKSRRQIAHYCKTCEPESTALSGDFVFDFVEGKDGTIWIATDGKGINGFSPLKKAVFHLDSAEPMNMLSYEKALCLDGDGNLWIGTSGSGLYRLDVQNQRFEHFYNSGSSDNNLSNNLIRDLTTDSKGNLWIATDGGGLNVYNTATGNFQVINASANFPQSLNTNAIYQLLFDRIGNLWVGTFNGGVNIHKAYNPPFFIHENLQEYRRMGLRSVLAIKEDDSGKLWLGSDGSGLFYAEMDKKQVQLSHFKALNGATSPKVVTCIERSPNGDIWFGSYAEGLYRFNEKTRTLHQYKYNPANPESLSHDNVWDIVADSNSGLWVGTLGNGLNYLAPGTNKFKRYLPIPGDENSLSSVQIVDVILDNNGSYLWAASEDKGLNRVEIATGKVQRYGKNVPEPAHRLSGDNLHCLFQDGQGRVWVGTEFNGLNCIENGKAAVRRYSTADGLPSNMIISITADKKGKLWIGTQKGIVRFDPETKKIADFGTDENLKNNNYNPRAANQLWDGRLVFGGTNGFSILSPESIHSNQNAPAVVFTKLKIAGQQVPIGIWNNRIVLNGELNDQQTTVRLSASDRGIVFEFTANDFTIPGKNRFAYLLEGFDSDWNLVGADHRAVFSNLNGGKYMLRVKAANATGVWGKESILTIKVQPPFWKTWWFILACALILGAMVYLGFKYILDHEKAEFEAQQLRSEQEIMRLKNETLLREMEDQQRKLSASVLETAHKNQFLVDLKAQIQKIEPPVHELRKVVRAIDSELNQEDYWEQFQLTFNQMHQAFVQKLHELHPDITNNELRLCCFIRMGMSNAEIATILNITVNGVEQSKYRLKRKIGLDKEESLNDYIKQV